MSCCYANGTRRNKKSRKCKQYTASKKRKSIKTIQKNTNKNIKKCSKGVNMPSQCIKDIIGFEKKQDEAFGMLKKPEYYDKIKHHLEQLCFPKELQINHKWHTISSYFIALDKSIVI